MTSVSFFDLDGTLTKGFMMTNFSKYLVSINLFSNNNYSKIEHLLGLFQENRMTYKEVVTEIPEVYALSLKDKKVDEIKRVARIYAEEIKDSFLHTYTINLVKMMKKHGMTIGISGAPVELVKCLGEYLDFDLSYGTELEVKNGTYTGKMKQNLSLRETKETVLEKIINEYNIDLRSSFGFGDTEHDLSFLSKVGNPIILNPNQELLSIARERGWTIFYSDDNIINKIRKIVIEQNL